MIQRIKKSVTHQGIGGKEFIIEDVIRTLTPNEISEKGVIEGNPACLNFMNRREDFTLDFPHKIHYIKIEGIGYIIAADEIETILEPHEDLNNIKLPDPNDFPSAGGGAGGAGAAGALASTTPTFEPINLNPIKNEDLLAGQALVKGLEESIAKSFGISNEQLKKGFIQGGGL